MISLPCARSWWLIATVTMLGVAPARSGAAQSGSTVAAGLGGAFGAYSGAVLGMLGGTIPCSQTFLAVTCIQITAAAGAAVGAVSGALIGAADDDRIGHGAVNAVVGAGAGVMVGAGLSRFTQRVGVRDIVAVAIAGGAIGAVPKGAGIGFGIGSAVGLLFMGVADVALPNAIAIAAIGIAAGGLTQWVLDAHSAQNSGTSFSVPLVARRITF